MSSSTTRRIVTMGQIATAFRIKDEGNKGDPKPKGGPQGERMFLVVPVLHSRHQAAIAQGKSEQRAAAEAVALREALEAMDDTAWWNYKFELCPGYLEFLDPYLDQAAEVLSL